MKKCSKKKKKVKRRKIEKRKKYECSTHLNNESFVATTIFIFRRENVFFQNLNPKGDPKIIFHVTIKSFY